MSSNLMATGIGGKVTLRIGLLTKETFYIPASHLDNYHAFSEAVMTLAESNLAGAEGPLNVFLLHAGTESRIHPWHWPTFSLLPSAHLLVDLPASVAAETKRFFISAASFRCPANAQLVFDPLQLVLSPPHTSKRLLSAILAHLNEQLAGVRKGVPDAAGVKIAAEHLVVALDAWPGEVGAVPLSDEFAVVAGDAQIFCDVARLPEF